MKRFRLYKRIKSRKRKRGKRGKGLYNRKQKGGFFGFEYFMNKLAGRKPPANNSLYQALGY